MLYYYLLFVSGISFWVFYAVTQILAHEVGEVAFENAIPKDMLSALAFAVVAGVIWWLHWRSLSTIWKTTNDGDQTFTKMHLWGVSLALMLVILVEGSLLLRDALFSVFYVLRSVSAADVASNILGLLVVVPLWRLHWQQIKLHSGSQANQPEAGEQPA